MASVLIRDAFDPGAAIREALTRLDNPPAIRRGTRVFLKPNLTYPRHKPGVTTSPRFIAAVLTVLHDLGARVTVGEGDGGYGAWSADLAMKGHGLDKICERFGARVVNLSTSPTRAINIEAHGKAFRESLPIVLLEDTDVFVTMPVPKVHAMTVYSGAIKNQWGCIPDSMRLRRHPNFEPLIWAINTALKPKLVLGDAEYILDRSGPLEGQPVYMNRVIASDDILAFDVAVCENIMRINPQVVSHFRAGKNSNAFQWSASVFDDRSTGPTHAFTLHRSLRHRVTAAAFPRQWAVNLLWFSPLGDFAHRILYTMTGNPIQAERRAIEAARRDNAR